MKLFLNEVPREYFYIGMKLKNNDGSIFYVKDINYSSSYGKAMVVVQEGNNHYTAVIFYRLLRYCRNIEVVVGRCKILKALLNEKVDCEL